MRYQGAQELFHDIAGIEREDRLRAALMFLWFFITTCAYYVIRPVRSSLLMTQIGPQALPWVYMATAAATGIAVFLYAKCAALPRRLLIGGTILFFTANLLVWRWLAAQTQAARLVGGGGWAWTAPAFYVWTDIFSIMAITIFWIYANDVFPPAKAKCLFGIIGAGGPAGGIAGAWLTEYLTSIVGTINLILVAAAIFMAAFFLFLALERLNRGFSAAAARTPRNAAGADLSELLPVMRWIFSSRFLLLLTIVVCMERMVPDFVDYIFQTLGKAAYLNQDDYTRFFANFEKWRNVGALAATLLLTGAILNKAGVGFALACVPATILVLGGLFVLMPVLGVVILLKGLEEGQRHSWFKAGKEVTYTATDHDTIYRAKAYIEMFFYRLARGVAGFLILLIVNVAGCGPVAVALAALPLALGWSYCAWSLGLEYKELERSRP